MDLAHISAHSDAPSVVGLSFVRDLHSQFNDPPWRLIDFRDHEDRFLARTIPPVPITVTPTLRDLKTSRDVHPINADR